MSTGQVVPYRTAVHEWYRSFEEAQEALVIKLQEQITIYRRKAEDYNKLLIQAYDLGEEDFTEPF